MGGSQCGDAASHPTTACIGPQRYEKSGKSTLFGTISHPAARKSARQRRGRGAERGCDAGAGAERDGDAGRRGRRTGGGTGRRRAVASRAGRTSRRAHDGGLRRAGCDGRAHEPGRRTGGGTATEGGGPDGGVDGWTGSLFSGRFSGRHAARATRAGRRPANREPRPGAPHPAAGCAGWSGCRSGRPAPRTRRRCGRGGG